MSEPALYQCIKYKRYLAKNRLNDASWLNNCCVECVGPGGLPLAKLRGTLTDELSLEVLALLAEECAEVTQRVGKIVRWGWDADFEGTTQRHKLEVELGDVVANVLLAAHNDQVSLGRILNHATSKLEKYQDDAEGPRQRLLHAATPGITNAQMLLTILARDDE